MDMDPEEDGGDDDIGEAGEWDPDADSDGSDLDEFEAFLDSGHAL